MVKTKHKQDIFDWNESSYQSRNKTWLHQQNHINKVIQNVLEIFFWKETIHICTNKLESTLNISKFIERTSKCMK